MKKKKLPKKPIPQYRIALPTMDSIHFEEVNRIVFMQADGNYTMLRLSDASELLVSQTLLGLERKLQDSPYFYRIHRGYIVNLNHIVQYMRGRGGCVVMNTGDNISVSVRRKEGLIQAIDDLFC